MVVWMNRLVTAERLAGDLAAAVGNHLVDVHVKLGAATGHPDVKRELVLMLAVQNLVAGTDDQVLLSVAEPAGLVVDQGGRLLDDRVGGDHLPRDEIVPDAEMFQGPLRLRSPELLGRHIHRSETIVFNARDSHDRLHVFDEVRARVFSPSPAEIAAETGISSETEACHEPLSLRTQCPLVISRRLASKRNQVRRSVSSIHVSIRLAVARSRYSSQTL